MKKPLINSKLAFWAKGLYQIGIDKHEKVTVNTSMDTKDFGKIIVNRAPAKVEKIAFIVQGIARFSGGITSVLRIGTYLEQFGHFIYYLDFTYQPKKEIEENATFNLSNYKGTIRDYYEVEQNEFDIVIATSWESFYRLSKFDAYKMDFVQDYEPYFNKFNEKFLLAKKTYELGAHIVSLGMWNVEQIKRECKTNSIFDQVSFPYEPREYMFDTRRNYDTYSKKNCFRIAVYTKEEGKRIPNILQYILSKASEELRKRNIELDILFFGLKKQYKVSIGKNLGKLRRIDLNKLYSNCDFGMCASMTNISLVPYEMIAAGLPIIEFNDGSYVDFLPGDSAMIIDYDYNTFVDKLVELIGNPEHIKRQVERGKKAISNLSWEKTAFEFNEIINSVVRDI